MKSKVGLQKIADIAGTSKMTVSLALRQSPRIAEETRNRVWKIAISLGYTANPEVARLMSAIRNTPTGGISLPIAYITTGTSKGIWRQSSTELQYWQGACDRAKEFGYYIDEYWIDEPRMSALRMSDILWNRGIKGIILPPFFRTLRQDARQLSIQIDWPRFSAIAISDMLTNPPLNRIIHDHYTSMLTALQGLVKLGYRRIGLCLTEHMDLTVNQRWQAAYLIYCANNPVGMTGSEPLIAADINPRLIQNWITKNKLDAIVSAECRMPRFFREMGLILGSEIAYADLDLNIDDPEYAGVSGIIQNSGVMGAAAVDMVVAAMNRNEVGLPGILKVLQVEGTWQDRGSTPKVS